MEALMRLQTPAGTDPVRQQTCRECSEAKPLDAFERLGSGGYRGTCKACRGSKRAEWKQLQRASPQHLEELLRRAEGAEVERLARLIAAAKERERIEKERAQLADASRLVRLAAAQARKDAIWQTMMSRRHQRALCGALQQSPSGVRTIAVDGGGFISVAELAKRVAEREEAVRATKALRLGEAVSTVRQTLPSPADVVSEVVRDDSDEARYEEAFGDWAPSWAAGMTGSHREAFSYA